MVRRASRLLAFFALSPLCGAASALTVQAGDHRAFWLWAGVRPQPALAQAERIYLLQGEVAAQAPVRLEARRPAVPHLAGPKLWLVVRTETLAWPPDVYLQLLRALVDWRAAGNDVEGIEVDFDAHTRGLAGYAAFLRNLRTRLPTGTKLGVTGLLDWSANGDPAGLDALAGAVDEAVLQIYQGRHVIAGYAAYLARLHSLRMPFRIGLLEGGDWVAPPLLASAPLYQGTVVFLRNDQAR